MEFVTKIIAIFMVFKSSNAGGILSGQSTFITDILTKNYTRFYDKTPELITSNGYPVEEHTITTDGGYILNFFRIPHGIVNQNGIVKRPPVICIHGHGGSSDDFVNNLTTSLGYLLADNGFDVWILNHRGNKYCLKHTDPQLNHHDFYQFNFDEMAKYDAAAYTDYILQNTGYNDLQIIAHSLGSTIFFCLLSSKPEYNQKVRQFHGIPAVATFNHPGFIVMLGAALVDVIEVIAKLLGIVEFPTSDPRSWYIANYCNSLLTPLCDVLLNGIPKFIESIDPSQTNMDGPSIFSSGSAIYNMFHYGQIAKARQFQYYDYDPVTNLIKYGQITPPVYNLSKVTAAVYLYYSDDDQYVSVADSADIRDMLPNVKDFYKIPTENYTHFNFLNDPDNNFLLNDNLIAKLDKY